MYETYLSLEVLQESSAFRYSSLAVFQYLHLFLIVSQLEHSGKHRIKYIWIYLVKRFTTVKKLQIVHNVTMCSSVIQATMGTSDLHSALYIGLPQLSSGFQFLYYFF